MDNDRAYRLSDFDYALPPELIAQQPARHRSGSRLLHVDGMRLEDLRFADLPALLAPNDLLVVNDTRVVKARLLGTKPTGGRVEIMIERVLDEHEALAQVRASHPPSPGGRVRVADAFDVEVLARDGRFARLRALDPRPLGVLLDRYGHVPLPPYIDRPDDADDRSRYQTVYAASPGAVAAPTAGLHFDEQLLATIRGRGNRIVTLTLHVGAGTFLPVDSEDLARHRMHREWYSIPAETAAAVADTHARGGRIVAVGTTSLRALEAAASPRGGLESGAAETDLFVTPGFRFRIVDRLVTNFHLPKSTLLMLVSAFGGFDALRHAYAHAMANRYRFYSYGDAMLIERRADRR